MENDLGAGGAFHPDGSAVTWSDVLASTGSADSGACGYPPRATTLSAWRITAGSWVAHTTV
jgi:hypothetical protein